jgi:hypothetical protein
VSLDFRSDQEDNGCMKYRGCVRDGQVVLKDGTVLPEGAEVTVSCPPEAESEQDRPKRRVALPLVPSQRPGSLRLTADRIAALLEQDDAPA